MNNEKHPESTPKTDFEKLQEDKIKLEIKDLRNRWPRLLIPLLPAIIIAGASIYLAHTSGLFNVQNERLELKKNKLELDISKFEQEKADIELVVQNLINDTLQLSRQRIQLAQ